MSDITERAARRVWDALIERGGPGRTLMTWPYCPEHDWCVAVAMAVIGEVGGSSAFEPAPASIVDNRREAGTIQD